MAATEKTLRLRILAAKLQRAELQAAEAQLERLQRAVYTEVYFDETEKQWACQHGGVTAYGDTPAMACENFDHLWVYGK